ncbi:MAG: hypothetical protein ABW219_08455 [Ilumatobacteraceae bacterium]
MTSAAAGRRRHGAATAGLVASFVLAAAVLGAVVLVRGRVLDAGTYTSALVAADADERAYTEVLADPELADLVEQLLGDLGLPAPASTQVRALGTNVLRWTVPPSVLRAGSEAVIGGALAYVRGDTDRLDVDVAIDGVIDRIDATAVTEVRTLLAAAADQTVTSIGEYRQAVVELAAQLASGTVPDSIPELGGATFDPFEVVDAIMDGLGDRVDDELRQQVTAAVLGDDSRDALITAVAVVVTDHATAAAERLRVGADDGGRTLDVVAALAEHARRPVGSIADSLDTARRAAAWFGPLTAVLAALVMVGSALALLWLGRHDRRRAVLVLAGTLVAAGVVSVALWWIVAGLARGPLDAAAGTGPDSWGLPSGLRAVLGDVRSEIATDLRGTVVRYGAVLVLTGAALGAGTVVGTRVPGLGTRPALLAAGAVAAVVAVTSSVAVSDVGPSERACNGHVELCDRSYDDVVQAATHNSMSSPDIVPVWPEHDGDIRVQLDAGVRALLIDTKYWPPVTAVGDLATALDDTETPVPAALAEAWYRTLGSLRDGREGTFLCHIHCAFGAVPFVESLQVVGDFLEENPDDVVTLIIQDAISPEDTAAAMAAAGLDELLYDHGVDDAWPTLGELIDRGQRLVVFAEEAGPPPAWYANAFESMQETPFLFTSVEQLSCVANRGRSDAPLFQMNHWIQRIAPDRVDSVTINRLDVLVDRARQCEAERGLRPNFLAVNFSNIGDVVEAAAVLNAAE